jgi:iron complex outermembrane receptor protein
VAAVSDIAPGSPLALSPKNKASLTASYLLPLPPTVGDLTASATFVHTDKQLTNYVYEDPATVALMQGNNFGSVPSTDLLNLNLDWTEVARSPFDVSFFVTNVMDKQYYQYIPGIASPGSGAEFAVLGVPRMYGARLRYHFGR